MLGGEYYFRFNHPLRANEDGSTYRKGQGTFEYARNELIQAQTARYGWAVVVNVATVD